MADDYKKQGRKEVGPGGINCPCCGPAPGKDRKKLHKRARTRLKRQLREEIEEYEQEETEEEITE